MAYKVIRYFTDLLDNDHVYHVGDKFPHDGRQVSEARIEELSSNKNRLGRAVIAPVSLEPSDSMPVLDSEPKVEETPIKTVEPEISTESERIEGKAETAKPKKTTSKRKASK